jgi:hypothetical protein
MRKIAAALAILSAGVVQAGDVDVARMFGTWNIEEGRPARVGGPIVISERQISWTSEDKRRCVVGYHIVSRGVAPIFPGGPVENGNPADAYTIVTLELEHQNCERNIGSFVISLTADQMDFAHFAVFSSEGGAQGWSAIRRVPSKELSP